MMFAAVSLSAALPKSRIRAVVRRQSISAISTSISVGAPNDSPCCAVSRTARTTAGCA